MIFAIIWQFSGWNSFQCGVARLECMCSMINVCVSVSVRVLLSALQMVMNDDLLKETLALTSLTDGSCGYLSPSSRPWRACSVCLSTCPDCSSCWPLGTSGRWRRCSTLGYRCGTSGRSGRTRTRRPCRSGRLFCTSSGWCGSARRTVRPFSATASGSACWTWRRTRSTGPWCNGTASSVPAVGQTVWV